MKIKNHKATITEYYDMQQIQDELYAKSLEGKIFTHLMEIISSPENIKLAYRAIKKNGGSNTSGTDKRDIRFFAQMSEEEYVSYITKVLNNYHPKKVKRVEIPKPNGKKRPLGVPCMEDRIVQQCILQVLEPICEAKFSEHSYGFRPNRSAENAMAEVYRLVQRSHMQFVVDFDIKGFFDNVNHRKLMRQLWTLGIQDTKLLQIIKQMLKAPIQMPDKSILYPDKGTPQGGILSPLLANVVLNELDWWISSQWMDFHKELKKPPKKQYHKDGSRILSNEYVTMRKSKLKEIYIVRYADDFKIFCKTRSDAVKIKAAVTDWLSRRLKLQVSEEKTSITNLKRNYSEFLGFKFKMQTKGNKQVINTRMCDKAVSATKATLKAQIKQIQRPQNGTNLFQRVSKYNAIVAGKQNYYGIANEVCIDFRNIQREISIIMENRLELKKRGKISIQFWADRYGKSKQVRWIDGIPLVPIGFYKSRNPMHKKSSINQYTPEGRVELRRQPNAELIVVMQYIMRNPIANRSVEYNDNRVSLYMGQLGRCAITGEYLEIGRMHCHHKLPLHLGGTDEYSNLVFVTDEVHKLIHAVNPDTISKYLKITSLDEKQIKKLNKLRKQAGLEEIKLNKSDI